MTKLPNSHFPINYLENSSSNGPTAEVFSVFPCSWRVSKTSAINTSSPLPGMKISYPTWQWNSVSSQSKQAGAWEKWRFMDLMEWFVPIPWMSFSSCATATLVRLNLEGNCVSMIRMLLQSATRLAQIIWSRFAAKSRELSKIKIQRAEKAWRLLGREYIISRLIAVHTVPDGFCSLLFLAYLQIPKVRGNWAFSSATEKRAGTSTCQNASKVFHQLLEFTE